jgi:hypothetical protein
MRLSNRILNFIFANIALTLLLLTVLMHFKYKTTLLEIVNERYNIVLNDTKWAIERGMSLGVELSELKNIQQIIEERTKSDESVTGMTVFSLSHNKMNPIFSTDEKLLNVKDDIKVKVREALYGSKKEFWYVKLNNQESYVGVTFKDALGIPTGGLYIIYSPQYIEQKQQKEIVLLYLRLLGILIIVLIVSYLISSRTTRDLDSSVREINNYLDQYSKKPHEIDVSQISIPDVEMKRYFIKTIETVNKLSKSFDHLKRLIDQVK